MTYSPTKDLAPDRLDPVCALLCSRCIRACRSRHRRRAGGARQGQSRARSRSATRGIGVANHISGRAACERTWGVAVQARALPRRRGRHQGHGPGESQVILNGATGDARRSWRRAMLRGLAVSGDKRVDSIKDLPSFAELKRHAIRRRLLAGPAHDRRHAGADAGAPQRRAHQRSSRRRTSPSGSRSIGGEIKAGVSARRSPTWIDDATTASYATASSKTPASRCSEPRTTAPRGDLRSFGVRAAFLIALALVAFVSHQRASPSAPPADMGPGLRAARAGVGHSRHSARPFLVTSFCLRRPRRFSPRRGAPLHDDPRVDRAVRRVCSPRSA